MLYHQREAAGPRTFCLNDLRETLEKVDLPKNIYKVSSNAERGGVKVSDK